MKLMNFHRILYFDVKKIFMLPMGHFYVFSVFVYFLKKERNHLYVEKLWNPTPKTHNIFN